MSEQKRRENDIFKNNGQNGDEEVAMTRKYGRLLIEDKPYKKKIHVPEPKEITSLTSQELDKILASSPVKGTTVQKLTSEFVGYTIAANTYDVIQETYIKLKLMLPQAKHIVCVYRIPGTRTFECEDYCDDGETAVGKSILKWMCEQKIEARAFFVARFTDGKKIGNERFLCYLQAAEEALKSNPINSITGENQLELITTELSNSSQVKEKTQWNKKFQQRRSFGHQKSKSHKEGLYKKEVTKCQ